MRFIAGGNLFSGSFQSQQKAKISNLIKLQRFFLRALLTKSMSFTEEPFKFALLLFTTLPLVLNIRS